MRYNSTGFYEEKLSLLGLGGNFFDTEKSNSVDREQISEMFRTAFENGVTFYFVPPSENAELLFGENLSKINRSEYFLCGGISLSDLSEEEDVAKAFASQLVRLKNGYFDYYVIENVGKESFEFFRENHVYDVFCNLRENGKIKHLGFSFCGTPEEWKTLLDDYQWDFVRMDLSYYSWNLLGADDFYRDLRKKKIPFIASDPFMGGVILDPPEEVFEVLKNGDPSLSMEEWALRWFYDKKGLLCIITDPSRPEELSEYAEILSSKKTLNSTKRHSIKVASEIFSAENCGDTDK
ncbi:MAG: aldo/keto reductase [Oscillospiraceae bacterium]|nr:aldo/keto reductase [Oscillospiraceae bacterium]